MISPLHKLALQRSFANDIQDNLWTPLKRGDYERLSQCCQKAPTLTFINKKGDTPLHLVAKKGDQRAASILLQYSNKHDITLENRKLETAPREAYKRGHVHIYRQILKAYPDEEEFRFINKCRKLAEEELAEEEVCETILNQLCKRALCHLDLDTCFLICSHSRSVDLRINFSETGDSLLHLACRANHKPLIELLLAYPRVEVNRLNKAFEPPLFDLCRFGDTEIFAKFLKAEGLYVVYQHPKTGKNVLDLVVEMSDSEKFSLLIPFFAN